MGIYGGTYHGRKYYFKVIHIEDEKKVLLENQENFKRSYVNVDYIVCKDGFINSEDIIVRQYVRDGAFLGYKGVGGWSSSGDTYYENLTSIDRYYEKNPIENFFKNWNMYFNAFLICSALGFFIGFLGLFFLFPIICLFIFLNNLPKK